jgi:hypothetical protein
MAVVGTIQGASLMVAAESSFGSVLSTAARELDTTTIGGLTAYPVRCLRASWNSAAGALKQMVFDQQEIAVRGGVPAPVVESAIDSSLPVKSIKGELSIDVEMRGFGTATPITTGMGIMLSSGLARTIRTPGISQSATYVSVNTFTVAGGDIAEITAGDILAIEQTDGTFRFCKVTLNNAGTVTTLEAHGYSGAATFVTRSCHMWYPTLTGSAGGNSIVLQFAPRDAVFTYLAVGARMSGCSVKKQGAHSLVMTLKFMVPDGAYSAAAVLPVAAKMLPYGIAGTTALRTLVSPVLVTQDHQSTAVPASGTASSLPVRDWSADIAIALEPTPDQGTRSGLSGYSVTTSELAGSFTLNAPSSGVDFREQLRQSEARAVGFSAAGSNDAGNGMCVWVGAAQATEDPGIAFEDSRRSQTVAFRAGDYAGDTSGAAYANVPFILAFTC